MYVSSSDQMRGRIYEYGYWSSKARNRGERNSGNTGAFMERTVLKKREQKD